MSTDELCGKFIRVVYLLLAIIITVLRDPQFSLPKPSILCMINLHDTSEKMFNSQINYSGCAHDHHNSYNYIVWVAKHVKGLLMWSSVTRPNVWHRTMYICCVTHGRVYVYMRKRFNKEGKLRVLARPAICTRVIKNIKFNITTILRIRVINTTEKVVFFCPNSYGVRICVMKMCL